MLTVKSNIPKMLSKNLKHLLKPLYQDMIAIPLFAWIAILLHVFEGWTSYFFDLNSMTFFHQKFSVDVETAGTLFGIQGVCSFLIAIPGGYLIDRKGLRWGLLVGWTVMLISRLILTFTEDERIAIVTTLIGVSIGGTFVSICLHLALDLMPEGNSKNTAFNFLYCSNNIGDSFASYTNPMITDIGGFNQFQLMFLASAFLALTGLAITLAFFWEPESIAVAKEEEKASIVSLIYQKQFWKAFALAFIFVGVRSLFRHLNSVVPLYMQNLYGIDVNYSYTIGINPTGITILTPIFGIFLRKIRNIVALIFCGTFISALSPIPMLVWRPAGNVWPVNISVMILTLGEAIYSPKLSQLAVSIPPKGQKALYTSLISLPNVFGTFLSGVQSGYLLEKFCNEPVSINYDYWGKYSCANLWLSVEAVAMTTPILLIFTGRFFSKSDNGL